MEKNYNKLVRDRIPEIIRNDGNTPVVRTLSDKDFLAMLEAKLDEEVAEFHADRTVEELADILEVVYALAEVGGVSADELERICTAKREKRGSFAKKIFLEKVIIP